MSAVHPDVIAIGRWTAADLSQDVPIWPARTLNDAIPLMCRHRGAIGVMLEWSGDASDLRDAILALRAVVQGMPILLRADEPPPGGLFTPQLGVYDLRETSIHEWIRLGTERLFRIYHRADRVGFDERLTPVQTDLVFRAAMGVVRARWYEAQNVTTNTMKDRIKEVCEGDKWFGSIEILARIVAER